MGFQPLLSKMWLYIGLSAYAGLLAGHPTGPVVNLILKWDFSLSNVKCGFNIGHSAQARLLARQQVQL
jgi:hypothetical protein